MSFLLKTIEKRLPSIMAEDVLFAKKKEEEKKGCYYWPPAASLVARRPLLCTISNALFTSCCESLRPSLCYDYYMSGHIRSVRLLLLFGLRPS